MIGRRRDHVSVAGRQPPEISEFRAYFPGVPRKLRWRRSIETEGAIASVENPSNTGGRLIAASKVNGTSVYNAAGESRGSVHDVMLDKASGKADYAILSFGGFLGIGERYHPLPRNQLTYDPQAGGFVVNLDRSHWKERELTRLTISGCGMSDVALTSTPTMAPVRGSVPRQAWVTLDWEWVGLSAKTARVAVAFGSDLGRHCIDPSP
ncbi:PRC-barrel domain-containing protein [Acidisoma sp. S159]|uniref:PRC-barrel domain-containing protein n=1 Tax=Acidisoma sp. S159 TaxID=1747225 RepID=UPI0020B124C3|nr:PRC-barrel domain-containing protein [Acidisoma sp. S159]